MQSLYHKMLPWLPLGFMAGLPFSVFMAVVAFMALMALATTSVPRWLHGIASKPNCGQLISHLMHLVCTLYGIHGLHPLHRLHSCHGLHSFHGLHGLALGLVHPQKDTNRKKKHGTKMLGNDIGGLAGLVLGHPQVHARNGEDKHMGWQTNLLINMHGLD